MTERNTTTQPPTSPDGLWRWDGTAWLPNTTATGARSWAQGRWATAGIVAGALVLAAVLYLAGELATSLGLAVMWGGIGLAAMLVLLLPVAIANQRRHHQLGLVAVFSALGLIPFLGWVFWIIALVMAAATPPTAPGARSELINR